MDDEESMRFQLCSAHPTISRSPDPSFNKLVEIGGSISAQAYDFLENIL